MSRRYDLIVFDLDGTLLDSARAVSTSMREALAAHGLPDVEDAVVDALVGLPLREIAARVSPPDTDDALVDLVVDDYRARYPAIAAETEQVFSGIPALLRLLRPRVPALAIATGKSQKGADHAVARHGFAPWFDLVLGGTAVPRGKPHPDLLLRVLAVLATPADRALMVGDTTFDLDMASAAGVDACGVTWGSHPEPLLRRSSPRWMARRVADLQTILLG